MTIKRLPKKKRDALILFLSALFILFLICGGAAYFFLTHDTALSPEKERVKVALAAYDTKYTDDEIIWLAQNADLLIMHESLSGKVALARQTHPGIIILKYKFSGMTNENAIGHSASGFGEVYTSHKDWFLADREGKPITDSYDSFSRTHSYYMDPGSEGWQEYSADDYLSGLQGWDGIFLDVINLEIGEMTQGGLKEYPDDSSYQDAMHRYLGHVHGRFQEEGKLLFINAATFPYQDNEPWSRFFPVVDGMADESFANRHHWGGQAFQPADRWERQVRAMELAGALGKFYIVIAHDRGDDTGDYEYNLCSYLLASHDRSFFYDMAGSRFRIQAFKEGFGRNDYMTSLGGPIGQRYQSSGLSLREFEGGLVIVNPGDQEVTIELERKYQKHNGKTVTVQPKDALILYRFS